MTDLELWCFANITCTFGALLSYVIILMRMEFIRNKINSEESKENIIEIERKRDLTVELLLFGSVAGLFAIFNEFLTAFLPLLFPLKKFSVLLDR